MLAVALLASLGLGAVHLRPSDGTAWSTGGPWSLEVTVPDAGGERVTLVEVTSNLGQLREQREEGDGRFRVVLTHQVTTPQVAVVVAHVRIGQRVERGWLSVPVLARRTVFIDTKPHALVSLRIGSRAEPPARADARGRAAISVLAPPGARVAYATSVDRVSNQVTREVPLDAPVVQRLHLAAGHPRETVSPSDPAPLPLELFVAREDGAPAMEHGVSLSTSQGTMGPLRRIAPGLFRTEFVAPKKLTSRTAEVLASLQGEPAVLARLSIGLRSGPPARVSLTMSELRAVEREATLELEAAAHDEHGNEADVSLRLSSTHGALRGDADGRRARLSVPLGDWGPSRVLVRASAADSRTELPIELPHRRWRLGAGALVGAQLGSNDARFTYVDGGAARWATSLRVEVALQAGHLPVELLGLLGGSLQGAQSARPAGDEEGVTVQGSARSAFGALGARYHYALGARWAVHVGVHGGPQLVGVELNDPARSARGRVLVARLGLGLGGTYVLGGGSLIAELEASSASVRRGTRVGPFDVSGNLGGVGISAGYVFRL